MRALLVNPWVYDFKAFDFWNKPAGLLIIANLLKKLNIKIDFIDCMDRNSPYYLTKTKTDQWGRGKYEHEVIEKPDIFKNIPRYYKRYGLPRDIFCKVIDSLEIPDLIFITSSMTYWYPGVFEAIRILKDRFPTSKIILGGIYATLCEEHARKYSGADILFAGSVADRQSDFYEILGIQKNELPATEEPMPDYSVYNKLDYASILTSKGCPFSCTYCATKILCPRFQTLSTNSILTQLEKLVNVAKNIAFFDDALLYNENFDQLLTEMIERYFSFNLHASNGLHCRYINESIAEKMLRAGFKTMYLSLETIDPNVQKATGGKVFTNEFMKAVKILYDAGFRSEQLHVYILLGMPGQAHEEIIESIKLCHQLKVHPHLCEFSPIPHTKEFEKTGFTEDTDPLYHNNLFYTWYYPEPKPEVYKEIKNLLSKRIT
ncbi:hypothetical protein A2Y85_03165 [candidate division WOR-3 bacterium RBG_13_43_14]|uniref:Radical SAM core domain-containing protein n=1 Tax=candidate division WOR-3 bacterium RBG_13_43_14 TaxID=1802590 RepID=A0A1F4UC84_UNCW3|nr:MAG: hypothetical protein A2Y85_03165 [candidate division WOR-3 bacterium RBG_13_43_14]